MARLVLAARGVAPSARAIAGAEIECHTRTLLEAAIKAVLGKPRDRPRIKPSTP